MKNRKLKIILLGRYSLSGIPAGPEKFSINLFNGLKENFNVVFVEHYFKTVKNGNFLKRFLGKDFINKDRNILRLGFIRLFFYLAVNRRSVVHVLSAERFTIPVYLYGKILNIKIITTLHSVLKYEIPRNKKKNKLDKSYRDLIWERLAISLSDKIILISRLHLELVKKYYLTGTKKTVVISAGIDPEFHECTLKKMFDDKINIVFYAGINDSIDRGLDYVLRLLSGLRERNFKIFVIGKISLEETYSLDFTIVEPMTKQELISFLRDKQLIIKSNSFDSFSLFTAEAMAAGLVPVISRNIGLSEFVRHRENGFLYSESGGSTLPELIRDILQHKYDLNKISENARDIVKFLSWEKTTEQYNRIYESL